MKSNTDEILYLDNLLNSQIDDDNNDIVCVLPLFKLLIDNIQKPEIHLDERDILIENIIEKFPKNEKKYFIS